MENTGVIRFKDSDVLVRKAEGNWESNPHDCFCCKKPVQQGRAVLLMNNYKYIPNILLHEECFDTAELRIENLLSDIEREYEQYKILHRIFS